MLRFNVQRFLDQNHIFYRTEGQGVKRAGSNKNELEIACPFCKAEGNPDPSQHLGINPVTGYWACWRNGSHRGKKLQRLIMRLLGCSYERASELMGIRTDYLPEGSFAALAKNPQAIFASKLKQQTKPLQMPDDFCEFKGFSSGKRFENYLISRGFNKIHLEQLTKQYDLRYATSGRYKDRVILPIYIDNKLAAWTGRSIFNNTNFRYLSSSEKDGATTTIKSTIFNYDQLKKTRSNVLFVTEGPLDALKMDFYGQKWGSRATCVFSKTATETQIALISEIASNFKRVVLLLDSNEQSSTLFLHSKLEHLNGKVVEGALPSTVKDPGDLHCRQVNQISLKYAVS